MQRVPGLFFSSSDGKDRGVFTAQEIGEGDLIEICPLILIPADEVKAIHKTVLHDFYFFCGKDSNVGAIALGMGSLYNHAENPNADFFINESDREMHIVSLRTIKAGEELTISYNNADDPRAKLWFEVE